MIWGLLSLKLDRFVTYCIVFNNLVSSFTWRGSWSDVMLSIFKFAQVLANRPDIIREDYMNELCILQDDVPPFPNQVMS